MRHFAITLGLALVLAAGTVSTASADYTYDITFTNVTRRQVVTPPVVVVHNDNYQLFTLGMPAGEGLRYLAEDGITDELETELSADPNVFDYAIAEAGLMPGESVTLQVNVAGAFRKLSAAGMLATTNDAFFGLNGLQIIRFINERTVFADVYDAGTEENNEDCDYIPGPPCDNPMVRATAGAEGFVHVHNGIFGGVDLDAPTWDWKNPGMKIHILR